jgi:hypothetical protein
VRRRIRVLWEDLETKVIEKKQLEEKNRKEHLVKLEYWVQKLPKGIWDFAQWDDFLDSLDSPVDEITLEKARDLLIKRVHTNPQTAKMWASKGIYVDQQTGLMWTLNGNIARRKMNWNDAKNWVKTITYGDYSDWRLPLKEEFEAFLKPCRFYPKVLFDIDGFDNVQLATYWSDSVVGSCYAWVTCVDDGSIRMFNINHVYYVWPVRTVRKSD